MSEEQVTTVREEWRELTPEVLGQPIVGGYRISNVGRVQSRRSPTGQGLGDAWRVVSGCVDDEGYRKHRFQATSGHTIQAHAHRLVALLFIGPPPSPEHEVCHWDGNGLNNTVGNLRWGTSLDNAADRERHGTVLKGADVGSSVLTVEQVLDLVQRRRAGESRANVAARFGVTEENVSHIMLGRSWGSITGIPPAPVEPRITLNAESAQEVVALCRAKVPRREVARRAGVSLSAVKAIMSGRAWSEATGIPKRTRSTRTGG